NLEALKLLQKSYCGKVKIIYIDPLETDKKVYLIRETKSTHDSDKRRLEENLKILCGQAHFKELNGVVYAVATSVAQVLSIDPLA
ncbi:MAG TPA: hypothetical protein PKD17_07995, partial [Cellvibrionaceae bacterium]|nr:hypothetical protein [Cellvibrionaceae bacterium]